MSDGRTSVPPVQRLMEAIDARKPRPVLLVYGDGHTFELHRPFPNRAPNLLALQVFGDRDVHAVEILVDPDDPAVFAVRPLWNPHMAPRG